MEFHSGRGHVLNVAPMRRKHKAKVRRPTEETTRSRADERDEGSRRGWRGRGPATLALGTALLLVAILLALPDYTGPRRGNEAEKAKPEQVSGSSQPAESGISCEVLMGRAKAILEGHEAATTAKWEEALDLLATCAVQEPENPFPKWELAVALMRAGRVSEAMAFLDDAIDPAGSNVELLRRGGVLLSGLGHHLQAARCLETYLTFVLRASSWEQFLVSTAQQPRDQWALVHEAAGGPEDLASTLELLLHSYLQGVSLEKAGYLYRVLIGLRGPENSPDLLAAYSSFAFGLGDLRMGIRHLRTYTELQYVAAGYGGQVEGYEVVAAHSLRLLLAGADSHVILMARNILHFGRPVWDELAYNCALGDNNVIDFERAAVTLMQVRAIYITCLFVQRLVSSLADEGAVAYSENRFGWTPLLHAAALGNGTLVDELMALHADAQTRTTAGHTPLHVAAMRGTYEVVPALLQAGVRPGDQDYFGRTALGVACLHRWSAPPMAGALGVEVPLHCPFPPRYAPPTRPILQGGWLGSGSVLPAALTEERCDIDIMATPNVTSFTLDYLSLGRPVLVRNASNSHVMRELYQQWQRVKMEAELGSLTTVQELHTSHWEGGEGRRGGGEGAGGSRVLLRTFMASMRDTFREHREVGRAAGGGDNLPPPQYIFERLAGDSPFLAHFELPFVLDPDHTHILPAPPYLHMGPSLAGENIHLHRSSWSLLVYGQRRVFLFPPPAAFYSKQLIWDWWRGRDQHSHNPPDPLECMQYPGDLLFVPDMWSAGAINLRESVGLKAEFIHGASEFSI